MNCSDIFVFMGSEPNINILNFNYKPDYLSLVIGAVNKMIALIIFVTILIYLLIVQIFFKKKITNMITSSVFSIFDDLLEENPEKHPYKRSVNNQVEINIPLNNVNEVFEILEKNYVKIEKLPSFEKNELNILNKKIENALRKDQENKEEGFNFDKDGEIYICNFEKCCCECLCRCWYEYIYKNCILRSLKKIDKILTNIWMKNLKGFSFFFIMMGSFVFNPLRNILSLLFNDCNSKVFDGVGKQFFFLFFHLIDLFCGSAVFVLYIFIISFLGTQAEFFKIYLFDKCYKARLIYFHLKKAIIFGFLHFCLKLCYKITMKTVYPFDYVLDPFSSSWIIFRNLFLILSIQFYHTNNTTSIDQDCMNIRAQAHYFAIQSNMLKRVPGAKDIYKILKKQIKSCKNFQLNIKENNKDNILIYLDFKLRKTFNKSKIFLNEELDIIVAQKFKNVLRNEGYVKYLPKILIILLIIHFFLNFLFSSVILIQTTTIIDASRFGGFFEIVRILIRIYENTIIPFLIYFCLKKTTYFHFRKE